MANHETALKGSKTENSLKAQKPVAVGKTAASKTAASKTAASKTAASRVVVPADPPTPSPEASADSVLAARDCATETAVLLDSIIHDLRTPLSAMSGWLEVLEAHFGEADGIVGRALLGLRRGVDSQTHGLSGLSDVLMKQRVDLPADARCSVLERMQHALADMRDRPDAPLDPVLAARLEPFRSLKPTASLTCMDAGSLLNEAFGTLLRALAASQDPADAPMSITASADKVLITVPGGNGDPTALRSLCVGLAGYPTRRPEIRAQVIWLTRSMFRRCGLALQMSPATGGGFHLLLSRAPAV